MNRTFFLLVVVIAVVGVTTGIGCTQSGPSVAPEVLAQHRAQLVLAEEPDGAQTVLEVREALLGEEVASHDHADHKHSEEDAHAEHEHAHEDHEHAHEEHAHETVAEVKATEPIDVMMVGSVGGLANPWEETQPDFPFVKNQAIFFLGDLGEVAELDAHGHVHAPGEECAFCAAHAAESSAMLAMVRFKDENGKVFPIEARQLFDLKEKDTVVIRGSARIVDGGMMVVEATGLYIRR